MGVLLTNHDTTEKA